MKEKLNLPEMESEKDLRCDMAERIKYIHHNPEKMTPSMLINDISKMFGNRIRRESEAIGMSHGYRRLLFHLAHCNGITQKNLVSLTHLTPPTVSVALRKMEDEGLVERRQNEDDMRETLVFLTEKGKSIDNFIIEKSKETEQVMLRNIDDKELQITKNVLVKILNNLIEEETDK